MEKENNGQLTIKERLEKLDAVLDEYERNIGLGTYSAEFDCKFTEYSTMSQSQREKLTVEQCAEISVILNSMAFHISRSTNRERARVTWASAQIEKIVARTADQFVGSWQQQENKAIEQDSSARKLNEIKHFAQERMDRMAYLPNMLKNLADSYNNLQRAKVMNNG